MVAKGEYDLMANRSHRRLPTLVYVRAHLHEADRMIRDSGARISIMARAASYAAHHIGRIYDRNRSPLQLLTLARGRGPYMTQKSSNRFRYPKSASLLPALEFAVAADS